MNVSFFLVFLFLGLIFLPILVCIVQIILLLTTNWLNKRCPNCSSKNTKFLIQTISRREERETTWTDLIETTIRFYKCLNCGHKFSDTKTETTRNHDEWQYGVND